MDLVNKLITEIQDAENKLEESTAIVKTSEDWDQVEQAFRDQFECLMVLSGASFDLLRLAGRLEEQPGNEFLIKRLKDTANKFKKYEAEL